MNLSKTQRSRETAEREFFAHPRYAARFWGRVQRGAGCWTWTGSRNAAGYGRYSVHSYPLYAHRLSYALNGGAIPDGLVVCHRCDNPSCVNPAHLFLGTPADNEADKIAKGRKPPVRYPSGHSKGERNAAARLSKADVAVIRGRLRAGARQNAIARDYGVAASTISAIANGRNWA